MMNRPISIYAKDLKLTASLKDYAQKKMDKLLKYGVKIIETKVELRFSESGRKHGKAFYAEVTMQLPKKILRVSEKNADIFAAIDSLEAKLRKQIRKYKTRFTLDREEIRAAKEAVSSE